MRVMMAPDYRDNQYQQLLREAVGNRDVEVVAGPPAVPFSPLLLWILVRRVDVLHLHWLHPFFLFGSYQRLYAIPGSQFVCQLAALVFVVQVQLATRLCDRVVWTAHNKCNHERRYRALDRRVSVEVATRVDAVQVWDRNTRDELAAYLGISDEKFVEIPHGNYAPVYEELPTPDEGRARRRLGVDSFERVYLYFGLIRPYKKIPDLIEAFLALDAEDACLVVAGSPKRSDLEERIRAKAANEDAVRLRLSYVPDEEVPRYFAACDAAIFPYEHIFNSGSVMLAMSLGRAFATPGAGSIPSVAPAGNVLYDDLDQGLRALHEKSSAELERVGERNRRVAERDFDWEAVGERTVAFYGAGSIG